MNHTASIALSAALLTGCTPGKTPDDTATPESLDTGSAPGDDTAVPDVTTMVFSSTDYTVYSLGTLDLENRTLQDSLTTLPGDSVLRRLHDGRIYNLNRFGYDVIRAYEPGVWDTPIFEISVGDGTANPHDIALCNDDLWVSLYGSNTLLILNPETGVVSDAVDLSAYAEGGEAAEFNALYCRGERIFAVAHQLDPVTYTSEGGTIVAVDTATRTPIEAFDVQPNPKTHPHPGDDNTLIVFSGHYGEGDGAITTVNLTTGAESEPLALEIDHGITFSGFAATEHHGVIIGTNYDYTATKVLCIDLDTWEMTEAFSIEAYTGAIAGDSHGTAWISMPTRYTEDGPGIEKPTGLQAFDIEGCARDGSLIETTLTPYSMTFY
jgi:hypothetical protein